MRENDDFSSQGAGFMKPLIPSSRTGTTENLELVFLLRPRVIVFTSPTEREYYNAVRGEPVRDKSFHYDFAPLAGEPKKIAPAVKEPAAASLPMGTVPADILNPGQGSATP